MGGHNRISAGKTWLFAGATLLGTMTMAAQAGAVEPVAPEHAPIAALTDATRESAQLAADTLQAIDDALQTIAAIPASPAPLAPLPEGAASQSITTTRANQTSPADVASEAHGESLAPSSENDSARSGVAESLTVDASTTATGPAAADTKPAPPSTVAGATLAISVASSSDDETLLGVAQVGDSIVTPNRPPCSANSEFLTDLRYSIQGTDTFVTDLRRLPISGNDVVIASWADWREPLENCDVSLAVYRTESDRFDPSATQQLLAYTQCLPETDMSTCNPSGDTHQLALRVPLNGFFQIDFVTGPPKRTLGPNDGWYSGQLTKSVNRLYGARTDGELLPTDLNTALNIAPINFNVGTSDITADSQVELQKAVSFLTGNVDVRIEIGGHTDADGSEEGNQRLSEARATAVRDFLVAAGIDGGRMDAVGYGELRPIATNDTPEGKAANRRIEFVVTP